MSALENKVAEKLLWLNGTKAAIKAAINTTGVNMPDTTVFSDYPEWIRKGLGMSTETGIKTWGEALLKALPGENTAIVFEETLENAPQNILIFRCEPRVLGCVTMVYGRSSSANKLAYSSTSSNYQISHIANAAAATFVAQSIDSAYPSSDNAMIVGATASGFTVHSPSSNVFNGLYVYFVF